MQQMPLGRTGRTISAIGLGCVTFGREIDEDMSYKIMDYAVEKGITFFDTAEGYGGGQARAGRRQSMGVDDVRETTGEVSSSERITGSWMQIRGCRDQITLCTKVGTGGSAENISRALSASLERLQTDHVDIYKMHSPDTNTPIVETVRAMTAERDAGRIGTFGGSNYSGAQLREALDASASGGLGRFEIVQPPYNLAQREGEEELFPLCSREEIAVTPYSPLGAGFFAGKYTPERSQIPARTRFDSVPGHADIYFDDSNFRKVESLRQKAEELGVPMVRLAMAFAMTHPDVTAVLTGAREFRHIDNALEALDMGLDPELRAEMCTWG